MAVLEKHAMATPSINWPFTMHQCLNLIAINWHSNNSRPRLRTFLFRIHLSRLNSITNLILQALAPLPGKPTYPANSYRLDAPRRISLTPWPRLSLVTFFQKRPPFISRTSLDFWHPLFFRAFQASVLMKHIAFLLFVPPIV